MIATSKTLLEKLKCKFCPQTFGKEFDLGTHTKICQYRGLGSISQKGSLTNKNQQTSGAKGNDKQTNVVERRGKVTKSTHNNSEKLKAINEKDAIRTKSKKRLLGQRNKGKSKRFHCYLCTFRSKFSITIKCHMRSVHGVNIPQTYECELCGTKLKSAIERNDHISSSCKKPENEKINKSVRARRSGKQMKSKSHRNKCQEFSGNENQNNHNGNDFEKMHSESKIGNLPNKDSNINSKVHAQYMLGKPVRPKIKKVTNVKKDDVSAFKKACKETETEEKAEKRSNAEVKLISCVNCSYCSKNAGDVRKHMKLVHDVTEAKIFKCDYCEEFFYKLVARKHHEKICAKNDNQIVAKTVRPSRLKRRANRGLVQLYPCVECTKVWTTLKRLRLHKKEDHPPKCQTEQEVFKCLQCTFSSLDPAVVCSHMISKHKVAKPKIHKCKFCQEKFGQLFKLNRHMKEDYCANTNRDFARNLAEAERQKWLYNCPHCKYGTYYQNRIASHLKMKHSSTELKYFKCFSCRNAFLKPKLLTNHKCIKKANLAQDLQENLEFHICYVCEEAFYTETGFESHKNAFNCTDGETFKIGNPKLDQSVNSPVDLNEKENLPITEPRKTHEDSSVTIQIPDYDDYAESNIIIQIAEDDTDHTHKNNMESCLGTVPLSDKQSDVTLLEEEMMPLQLDDLAIWPVEVPEEVQWVSEADNAHAENAEYLQNFSEQTFNIYGGEEFNFVDPLSDSMLYY